ncbi:SoxR reducing system RseC family protein [Thalassotalea castellviae]|uniref:SoxR reducing system RseC family protein n=1 Tax=Thalassotalea castellviae TaxID=3075612 RepID=A0ABU3A3G8_9GAMM|nr:SoxR reducing system RseC family protein [Thalassotalea sp. W431]MDT0603526.1 SoxR reducing system RseC family protein [Thalassotalea sp. W431]
MIKEEARVTAITQDSVTVESIVKSTCSGCQQLESCGSGQIAKAFPQKKTTYTVRSELSVKVGDRVIIGLSEKLLLSAAWQVYIWPLIGLFIGSFLGQSLLDANLISHELWALPMAILGGYLGYFLAKRQQFIMRDKPEWHPTLIDVLPTNKKD